MSWDFALDGQTGDWLFDEKHDLQGISGPEQVNQRIITRCKIPFETFLPDTEGDLGSTLHEIQGGTNPNDLSPIEEAVENALLPMEDISVDSVTATLLDDGRVSLQVEWSPIVSDSEDEDDPSTTDSVPVPAFTVETTVTL